MHGASPLLSLQGATRRGDPRIFPFVIARSNATRQSTPFPFCHCEEQRDAAIQPNRNFVIRNYDPDWIATSALSGLPRDDKADVEKKRHLA
jgi:hypothetical protein